MKSSKELNTLLFELSRAPSPLEKAKITVRSWRALRRLSPWELKVLARESGFNGAQELLEGLTKSKGGIAPAMALSALSKIRSQDSKEFSTFIDDLRNPERREEALLRATDMAAEVLDSSTGEDSANEAETIVEEEPSEEEPVFIDDPPTPVDHDLEVSDEGEVFVLPPEPEPEVIEESVEVQSPTEEEEKIPDPEPKIEPEKESVIDWSRWETTSQVPESLTERVTDSRPRDSVFVPRQGTIAAALDTENSPLSRLQRLRREIPKLKAASLDELRDVLEVFSKNWARRRALSALLEAGVPADPIHALRLIEGLERELDRRWCLGVLARRGELKGELGERALQLISSPAARRRIAAQSC